MNAASQLEAYERMQPRTSTEHNGVTMTFATPSVLTHWRVKSIRQKEPCTLEWIETFERDEVFLDCGANVGMYSIWAGATRGLKVYAFEPEAQNYALLNRNIMLNGLGSQVTAFCIGLSDISALSQLHITDLRVGGSCHSVGEQLDFKLQEKRSVFHQGCVAMQLDELVASGAISVPSHIKIDVDGLEHKVIAGAENVLTNRAVKSLLIEINQNLPQHMNIVTQLDELGFKFDGAQVAAAERKEGAFKGVAEYIFRR